MPDTAAAVLSPVEAGAVVGAPVHAVYKFVAERLPAEALVRRDGRPALTWWGTVCLALDRVLPRDVPLGVRRRLYLVILTRGEDDAESPARVEEGVLVYEVDVKSAARRVDEGLARYRGAMALIVEDEAVQGGAATFRGTRILVHQIAALLEAGATEEELREDYPRLTPAMIRAAPIYARAHPRRGRPRSPGWRAREGEGGGQHAAG